MPFNKLLQRQLKKLHLSLEKMPTFEKWEQFLLTINRAYENYDQERYLSNRAFEISSREMNELNRKLETATEIAKLGYWHYNAGTRKMTWSKDVAEKFGYDVELPEPTLDELLERINEKDRVVLREKIRLALNEGKEYESEFLFTTFDKGEKRWFHVIGKPNILNHPNTILYGTLMDITKRKTIEEELRTVNEKLMASARRAGMADVATSILHNVGNVLNSANVSVGLIAELVNQTHIQKLLTVMSYIESNKNQLAVYLTEDERGKLIPKYLHDVTAQIQKNTEILNVEMINLKEHLQHVKDIAAQQRIVSGVSGIYEKLYVPEIIDNALKMIGGETTHSKIELFKLFKSYDFIVTDKTKLLQILVNLLQNAKEAVLDVKHLERKIAIEVEKVPDKNVILITISDNGCGISKDNLTKIFSFGFTTKKEGHGFGLHSSALAAKELGGSLHATSEGVNHGATFILTLPITVKRGQHDVTTSHQLADYSDR